MDVFDASLFGLDCFTYVWIGFCRRSNAVQVPADMQS